MALSYALWAKISASSGEGSCVVDHRPAAGGVTAAECSPALFFSLPLPEITSPATTVLQGALLLEMVLGLGGASLPPRPVPRRRSRAGGCQLARVQSNSLLVELEQQHRAGMDPGGEGAGTGYQLPAAIGNDIAARSADDHVDTPTGHPPAPQPACSDQSNVRGLVHPQLQQQQDHGASTEAQSLPPQPTVAPAVAAAEQAASHVKQEQQAQRDQQTAAAPRPGKQAAGSRKRKSAATLSGPPSTSQAQPEAAHSGSHGAWVRRSRLGPADTPTASAGRSKRHASSAGAGNAAAAAAPAAKRRKSAAAADGRASKSPLHHRPSKYADVLHRAVVVPGAIF